MTMRRPLVEGYFANAIPRSCALNHGYMTDKDPMIYGCHAQPMIGRDRMADLMRRRLVEALGM
jgi:hypothetical protein